MERMRQNGCDVIQTEGDADVHIAKAAISMSAFRPTTLIGEGTDLIVLLLYHAQVSKCNALNFRSDKAKSYVYNIKVLKQVLGEAVCNDLLFLHAFTGRDSVSRVFGIGKKLGFQRIIKKEKAVKDCSKAFSRPKQSQDVVETNGCKAMDSLVSIRYNICSARKLRELECSSRQNVSHRPPRPVNFIPCGLTTRLWSGWDVVMKWIHLSRDGRYNNNNNNNNTEKNLFQ